MKRGAWWTAHERSSWQQGLWKPAARRAHRPDSGTQPRWGNPATTRRRYWHDTTEEDGARYFQYLQRQIKSYSSSLPYPVFRSFSSWWFWDRELNRDWRRNQKRCSIFGVLTVPLFRNNLTPWGFDYGSSNHVSRLEKETTINVFGKKRKSLVKYKIYPGFFLFQQQQLDPEKRLRYHKSRTQTLWKTTHRASCYLFYRLPKRPNKVQSHP